MGVVRQEISRPTLHSLGLVRGEGEGARDCGCARLLRKGLARGGEAWAIHPCVVWARIIIPEGRHWELSQSGECIRAWVSLGWEKRGHCDHGNVSRRGCLQNV